ncbi:MAG: hypothetical protein KDN05_00030 [Verrucomicrobiae bacterium]|nr:hypothetical protein [Verrucomicrobiae bacterium]
MVSLSLMVLLTIIALGLLTLSSISLRSTTNGNAIAEARANARLALMLAIGQLQKELGPDQRISASASILGKPQNSGTGTSNSTWLGCWNSWAGDNRFIAKRNSESDLAPDISENRKDSFRRWLVSPAVSLNLDELDAARSSLSGGSILLVGKGTLGEQAQDEQMARVPSLSIDSASDAKRTQGALAWWIGDESQKGLVHAGRNESDLGEPAQVLAEADSPSSIAEELYPGFNGPSPADEIKKASISRKTLELLSNTDAKLGSLYHDLTNHARSVMTDVREGGLKRDINLLAEHYDANFDERNGLPITDEFMMYDFDTKHRVPLHDLLTYYSLYKAQPAGSRGVLVSNGSKKPYTSSISHNEWSANKTALTTNLYRVPVQVKTQLAIWARAERSGPSRDRPYRLKFRFTPILTIWNPYNIPLVVNSMRGDELAIDLMGVSGDIAVWKPYKSSWRESSSLGGLTSGSGDDSNTTRELARMTIKQSVTFEPGEVRVFSMNKVYDNLRDVRELVPGYEPISGNEIDYYDLERSRGGGPDNPDDKQYTFEAREQIGIGFGESSEVKLKHSQGVAFETRPAPINNDTAWRIQALYSRRTVEYTADALRKFNNLIFKQGSRLDGVRSPGQDGTILYQQPYSMRNLDSKEGVIVGIFTYGIAGETEASDQWSGSQPRFPARPFLHSLPTAESPWIQDLSTAALYNLGWSWRIEDGNEASTEIVVDGEEGRYGGGWSAATGQSHVVQFELPQRPFHSLAQFSNAALGGWSIARNRPDDRSGGLNAHETVTAMGQGGLFPAVSMPIGNSYAHPQIPPEKAFTQWLMRKYENGFRNEPFVDHSYLANFALWDEYFMSSMADQTAGLYRSSQVQGRKAIQMAQDFFGPDATPLPNQRFLPMADAPWDKLRPELFKGNTPGDDAYAKIARYLVLEGGFNVNSTSVEAWKTLFASLRNKPTLVLPANSQSLKFDFEKHHDTTPVVENSIATGDSIEADSNLRSDSYAPEQWVGGFTLTDSQIEKLAEEMVKQVRLRGPFLSLSDFINRRLTPDVDLAKQGALQAAIEAAGLNAAASGRTVDTSRPSEFLRQQNEQDSDPIQFPEAAKGSTIRGSMAYIDQADVLRGIDSQLVPRGDTFVIRTCGQSKDAAGKVLATVYCEAVVQRLPTYLDPADKPETRAADLTSEINRSFGRKFIIESFRWLSPEEI